MDILFKEKLSAGEQSRIHFEEVSKKKNKEQYYVAGNNGYILFITGSGITVKEARTNAYELINKIVIPKMMYRTDIGIKFIERDKGLLEDLGWL